MMSRRLRSRNRHEGQLFVIERNGVEVECEIVQQDPDGRIQVRYNEGQGELEEHTFEWLAFEDIRELQPNSQLNGTSSSSSASTSRKRKRDASTPSSGAVPSREDSAVASTSASVRQDDGSTGAAVTHEDRRPMTEEELDMRDHRKRTANRNFDKVIFRKWQIKTWYYSPYPFSSTEEEDYAATQSSNKLPSTKIHNVNRSTLRAHGRTSDLLAGGSSRDNAHSGKAILWVCDRCFKYMREGRAYELHMKNCQPNHPPGRKVYERGAHVIWEVDGAKEKLFCQNLSLFGKLFIDIKTLFFDCENFMFYLFTDADSQRDHVYGFFSKEKMSYDDYNLACIVIFPPYQKQRFGILLIEFSYELSRRSGKTGTPERPLSDLGLRSYLSYWITVLVHFFRRLLSIAPQELHHGFSDPEDDLLSFVDQSLNNGLAQFNHKKKKSTIWKAGVDADEARHNNNVIAVTNGDNDLLYQSMRHFRTVANPDGSATTHVFANCTLENIAKATRLRMEDVAFALHECGLLNRVRTVSGEMEGTEQTVIVISREMVEAIAEQRNIRKLVMELEYVLL